MAIIILNPFRKQTVPKTDDEVNAEINAPLPLTPISHLKRLFDYKREKSINSPKKSGLSKIH
jgi:hypothetical protein